MNMFQGWAVAASAQVTVLSFSALWLMSLSRNDASRRHSVGLIALMLILCSPLSVALLPQGTWWSWRSQSVSASKLSEAETRSDVPISAFSVSTGDEVGIVLTDRSQESATESVNASSPTGTPSKSLVTSERISNPEVDVPQVAELHPVHFLRQLFESTLLVCLYDSRRNSGADVCWC
jgi:hypothetical protein